MKFSGEPSSDDHALTTGKGDAHEANRALDDVIPLRLGNVGLAEGLPLEGGFGIEGLVNHTAATALAVELAQALPRAEGEPFAVLRRKALIGGQHPPALGGR